MAVGAPLSILPMTNRFAAAAVERAAGYCAPANAVGPCLAVPTPWVPDALARGNTLRRRACVHWTSRDVTGWLAAQRAAGSQIVGVELADEAVRLADLTPARQRTAC
jgi:hypothetical protein